MTTRNCNGCRHFTPAGFDNMGWCNHPKRKLSSDAKVFVRGAQLPCRNDWAVDLFEEFGGGDLAFAFDVVDLATDHAADGAGGGGEFGDEGAAVGEPAEDFEGERKERIAGEKPRQPRPS